MEVLKTEHHTRRVEDGPGLGEDVCVDVHHEVSSGRVFHDEADVGVGLEAGEHVDEERVAHGVGHLEDALLGQERLDLVASDYVAFLERLDGKVFARVQVSGQDNLQRSIVNTPNRHTQLHVSFYLSEVSPAQDGAELEAVESHL